MRKSNVNRGKVTAVLYPLVADTEFVRLILYEKYWGRQKKM